jgi:hypothetical protein
MATAAYSATLDQSFWQKMALGIALFTVFGFSQFFFRGYSNPYTAPIHVHLHGVVMLCWLALTTVQPWLISRDNIALHRALGWTGIVFAAALVGLGSYTGIYSIAHHRQPPFFTPAYFLGLTQIGIVAFGAMIAAAVAMRRNLDWHRRLMIGALVLLMEPAFGRLLPMPLMGIWGEWVVMAIQLTTLAIVARHDRKRFVGIHPATIVSALVVMFAHVAVTLASLTPVFESWAAAIAAR